MVTRARKSTAVAPLNGDVFPVSGGPALQLVALDVIDLPAQVRTVFDEAALAELAEDIKVRGILQAVLLCSPVDGRYRFIAGERRIRAARIAGLSAIPALVGDATEEQVEDMQLAENIQREDLNLQDEARAVRKLYDRLGKVDRVAQRVHKSAAWVSKRLSMTYGDFDWRAKKLLEDGITEDIELLQCVVKVVALDQFAASDLDREIRAGNAGRKEARAVLARLKKKPAAPKTAAPGAAAVGGGGSGSEGSGEPGSGRPVFDVRAVPAAGGGASGSEVSGGHDGEPSAFDARGVLRKLVANLWHADCPPVVDLLNEHELSADQQAAILAVCRDAFERGAACGSSDAFVLLRDVAMWQAREELETWSLAAFTLGAVGMPFELETLLCEVSLAVRGA